MLHPAAEGVLRIRETEIQPSALRALFGAKASKGYELMLFDGRGDLIGISTAPVRDKALDEYFSLNAKQAQEAVLVGVSYRTNDANGFMDFGAPRHVVTDPRLPDRCYTVSALGWLAI